MKDTLNSTRVQIAAPYGGAVQSNGSFAKVTAQLGSSLPAMTRLIAGFEARLGVQLFNHTTRNVYLTEAGLRFIQRAQALLTDLDDAEKEAMGVNSIPAGHPVLTASVTMRRSLLPPIVNAFLQRHPRVSTKIVPLDCLVNLVEEGIDIALRIAPHARLQFGVQRDWRGQAHSCRQPGVLSKRGVPAAPPDLKSHSIIEFTGLMPDREWRYGAGQKAGRVSLKPQLEITDALTATSSAEDGDGVTLALSYMVADAIRNGRLVELLRDDAAPPVPVQLVYPKSRLAAPKLRRFHRLCNAAIEGGLERPDPRIDRRHENFDAREPVSPLNVRSARKKKTAATERSSTCASEV